MVHVGVAGTPVEQAQTTTDAHLVRLAESAARVAARVADPHTQQAIGFILELLVVLMRRTQASQAGDALSKQSFASSLTVSWISDCGNSHHPDESDLLPVDSGELGFASPENQKETGTVSLRAGSASPWAGAAPPNFARPRTFAGAGSQQQPPWPQEAETPREAQSQAPIIVTPPPRRDAVPKRRLGAHLVARAARAERRGGTLTVPELPVHDSTDDEQKRSGSSCDPACRSMDMDEVGQPVHPGWTGAMERHTGADSRSVLGSSRRMYETSPPLGGANRAHFATETRCVVRVRPPDRFFAATVGELPSAASFDRSGHRARSERSGRSLRVRQGFGNVSQEAKEDTLRQLRRLAESDREAPSSRRQRSLSGRRSVYRSESPTTGGFAATIGELPLWLRHDWST